MPRGVRPARRVAPPWATRGRSEVAASSGLRRRLERGRPLRRGRALAWCGTEYRPSEAVDAERPDGLCAVGGPRLPHPRRSRDEREEEGRVVAEERDLIAAVPVGELGQAEEGDAARADRGHGGERPSGGIGGEDRGPAGGGAQRVPPAVDGEVVVVPPERRREADQGWLPLTRPRSLPAGGVGIAEGETEPCEEGPEIVRATLRGGEEQECAAAAHVAVQRHEFLFREIVADLALTTAIAHGGGAAETGEDDQSVPREDRLGEAEILVLPGEARGGDVLADGEEPIQLADPARAERRAAMHALAIVDQDRRAIGRSVRGAEIGQTEDQGERQGHHPPAYRPTTPVHRFPSQFVHRIAPITLQRAVVTSSAIGSCGAPGDIVLATQAVGVARGGVIDGNGRRGAVTPRDGSGSPAKARSHGWTSIAAYAAAVDGLGMLPPRVRPNCHNASRVTAAAPHQTSALASPSPPRLPKSPQDGLPFCLGGTSGAGAGSTG